MKTTLLCVLACVVLIGSARRVPKSNNERSEIASGAKTFSELLFSFNPSTVAPQPRLVANGHHPNDLHSALHTRRSEIPFMNVPIEKRTDFGAVLGTASSLCLISGMVNVVAFMEMGIPCTHHTGSSTHIGRLLGTCAPFGGLTPGAASQSLLVLLVTYVLGSAVAGFAKCDGEKVFAGKTSWGLLASALVVAAGAGLHTATGAVVPTLALWSFAQGLQNAISTSAAAFIGFPVRTTHVTGAATDLGSGIGQWLSAKMDGKPLPSLRKQVVFATSIFFFGLGGFIARFLQPIYGSLSALLPATILALLAIGRPFGTTVSNGAAKAS